MEHTVVPGHEWAEARKALLMKEKELTHLREQLAQARRDLPWEAVTEDYSFEGPAGEVTLAGLFDGRSQLIVYHFMFDPGDDEGCPHCSFWADNFDGAPVHLAARDVTLTAVSRAPFAKIAAYKRRMGWTFPWVSSNRSSFNYDFGASFTPEALAARTAACNYGSADPGFEDREGISVFVKKTARSSIRTRHMPGASTWSMAPTSSLTWCPRAATSRQATPSSGFGATMGTAREQTPAPHLARRRVARIHL
jgi:predicted dithiol-disulfide oxidoreductase (DUF899 family)